MASVLESSSLIIHLLEKGVKFKADTFMLTGYCSPMSFAEVIQELPSLSVAERQYVIRRALELDELPLSAEDQSLIAARLQAHSENPSTISLDSIKARLRSRFPQ
jgi:hypothetical protein